MATTISTKIKASAITIETLDAAVVAAGLSQRKVVHNGFEFSIALDGTTTPAVSIVADQLIAAATSGTIDLTALATTQGTRSASGLKLVALRLTNLSAAHVFSIAVGASSGYVIGGNPIAVKPGGSVLVYFADALADVDGTHKTLDWTFNSGASGGVQVTLILG